MLEQVCTSAWRWTSVNLANPHGQLLWSAWSGSAIPSQRKLCSCREPGRSVWTRGNTHFESRCGVIWNTWRHENPHMHTRFSVDFPVWSSQMQSLCSSEDAMVLLDLMESQYYELQLQLYDIQAEILQCEELLLTAQLDSIHRQMTGTFTCWFQDLFRSFKTY